MTDRAVLTVRPGDYSADDLRMIVAGMMGAGEPEVCDVVAAVIVHPAGGGHQFAILTTIPDDPAGMAAILRHAARHVHGGCKHCARGNRKRNGRAGR